MIARRNLDISHLNDISNLPHKANSYSPSTEDSGSPRHGVGKEWSKPSIKKDKEKSQLCKKFVQFGFCPYEKKCKFAHGCHQLRKNHEPNSKYKTKQCGVFLTTGCCMYGERCNFIHPKPTSASLTQCCGGFQEVKAEGRFQSRLLSLLQLE